MITLRRDQDFRGVYASGKTIENECFRLRYLPNRKGAARVGIVVTKRAGSAVIRNRIRRRVIAAFNEVDFLLPHFDLVVFPVKSTKNVDFLVLCKYLNEILIKACFC